MLRQLYSMQLIKLIFMLSHQHYCITKRMKFIYKKMLNKISSQAYMVGGKMNSLRFFLPFHWNTQASLEHTLAFLARIYTAQRRAARSPPAARCYCRKPAAPPGSARSAGRWHHAPDAWSSAWHTGNMHQSPQIHQRSVKHLSLWHLIAHFHRFTSRFSNPVVVDVTPCKF